ncbi:MAG: hypothetical protein K0S01_3420 [Herbinix sp.]|jgi:hypothetical protein|nr:hypothetical protein [Herbinix sp.]
MMDVNVASNNNPNNIRMVHKSVMPYGVRVNRFYCQLFWECKFLMSQNSNTITQIIP